MELLSFESRVLEGNPLGDPATRALPIYLPAGYDAAHARGYPVVYLLAGFTGSGLSFLNWNPWQESLPQRLDRLIAAGSMAPAIAVFPDCFTRLGGSQYVNSAALGRYEDYLCDEIVPFVDQRFRTRGAGGRALAGKSSGGIGALWTALRRPGLFSAIASHSGDCAFELSLLPTFPQAAVALERASGLSALWPRLLAGEGPAAASHDLLTVLTCAAAYSPPSKGEGWGFRLPFDPETAALREEVFAHWLTFDPIRAVRSRPAALAQLSLLYLDAGTSDEYALQFGARQLARTLEELGISHRHEEFEGGHRNTSHRYDVSLPALVAALGD